MGKPIPNHRGFAGNSIAFLAFKVPKETAVAAKFAQLSASACDAECAGYSFNSGFSDCRWESREMPGGGLSSLIQLLRSEAQMKTQGVPENGSQIDYIHRTRCGLCCWKRCNGSRSHNEGRIRQA